tara:strand:+ start:850 stop:1371 length:522 start_codon:yes stop_codon:yes gene_type:complete
MAIFKKLRNKIDKVRKKYIPTFGEQRSKAIREGKKEFKSTRDDQKKGNLSYSTMGKKEVQNKISKDKKDYGVDPVDQIEPKYEKATGTKVSSFGQAFKNARKAKQNSFMHKGKKYTTRLKGQLNNTNRIPELSGKTSKKIKKIVRGNDSDYLTVSARKGGLIRGIPKLAKKGY